MSTKSQLFVITKFTKDFVKISKRGITKIVKVNYHK